MQPQTSITPTFQQNQYNDRATFVTPNLREFRTSQFPMLEQTPRFVEHLRQRRLLMLAGDPLIRKHPVACQIAVILQNELSRLNGGLPVDIQVREWLGTDERTLDRRLEQFDKPTIFLLPGLLPQHVDYDVQRLRLALHDTHYAIVLIEEETPWRQSHSNNLIEPYWKSLQTQDLFPPAILLKFFTERLRREPNDLLKTNLRYSRGRVVFAGQSIERILTELKTPEQVDDFVRQLTSYAVSGTVTAANIAASIKNVQANYTPLLQWYYRLNEPRKQLLALALCLLDGMFERQFFVAVDGLIDQAWRKRVSSWHAIDYRDLTPLERFFEFALVDNDDRIVKFKSREQRQMLLRFAWQLHQRSVESVLPIFYSYIKQSIDAPRNNIELFATGGYSDRLRQVLGDALSDIGLIDSTAIIPILLRLAVHTNIGVQTVAAKSIARWRTLGAEPLALGLLTNLDIAAHKRNSCFPR